MQQRSISLYQTNVAEGGATIDDTPDYIMIGGFVRLRGNSRSAQSWESQTAIARAREGWEGQGVGTVPREKRFLAAVGRLSGRRRWSKAGAWSADLPLLKR
jgi:hypothetical protein